LISWKEAFGYLDWSDSSEVTNADTVITKEIPDLISPDNPEAAWIASRLESITHWQLYTLGEATRQAGTNVSIPMVSPSLAVIFKYISAESPFDDMNLDVPIYNILRRNGFESFGDISHLRIDDLRGLGTLGQKKLDSLLTALVIYQAIRFKFAITKKQLNTATNEVPQVPLDPLDFSWIETYSPINYPNVNSGLNMLALYQVLSGNGNTPLITNTELLPIEASSHPLLAMSAKDWLGNVVVPSLEDLVFELFEKWNENELKVLAGRFLSAKPKTLDAIGASIGLTRERIRQLEKKIKTDYANFSKRNWMHGALLQAMQNFAAEPKRRSDFRRLDSSLEISYLGKKVDLIDFYIGMGELEIRDEWICSDFSSFENLFDNIWESVSSNGVSVDSAKFEEAYIESGPNRSKRFIQAWLDYNGYSKFRKQWYLKKGKPIPDLAEIVLTIRGESMTLEQIFEAMEVNKAIRSLHNTLITNDKFSKLGKHSWGLAEWNQETYSGIRDAILKYVDEKGSVALSTLTKTFVEKYGVKTSSVETYAQAYPLKVENGMVSKAPVKTENTHRKTIAQTRNMYQTENGLALRIKINGEHLRGSGSPCPAALASFLKLVPLEKRKLTWVHGTFMISDMGSVTNLPSIRPACERLGVGIGEELLLIFDAATVRAEKLVTQESTQEYIRQISQTGSDKDIRTALSSALQFTEKVSSKQIIEVLENRKEYDLIALATKVMGNN
jgi:hypothetical protein